MSVVTKPLTQVQRVPVEHLAALRSENQETARHAAHLLATEAKQVGLGLREYLNYKIDVRLGENAGRHVASDNTRLSGYEAALQYLNLPVRDALGEGISLQAAADTFATFPGTRLLFPQVVDDAVRWKFRQTMFERIEPMVFQSRTIAQPEMISMVVNDTQADYQAGTSAIAEFGRIPISSIRSQDQLVKIWKFGRGWRTSYEFARRASIDIMTPFAARTEREIELGKVLQATSMLINGDGVQPAATSVNQSSFNTPVGSNSTNGTISYKHLIAWLVSRAKAGFPIDTVVGNYDAYLQWLFMFSIPTTTQGEPNADTLARSGFTIRGVPILTGTVDFVLSSGAPANKLIGYSRADTLEELIEAGSQIEENERAIVNQSVTYVRTENSGFKLAFGDTREIFNFGA